MNLDILSSTLRMMKISVARSTAIDASGSVGLSFPAHTGGSKFFTVAKGEWWVTVSGQKKKHHLRQGDCFLLASGRPFHLATAREPKIFIPAEIAVKKMKKGRIILGGGGEALLLGAAFRFEGAATGLLFTGLPPVVHISGSSEYASALRLSLDRFADEFDGHHLGRAFMINQLAPIILLQLLRAHLMTAKNEKSLLMLLADRKLSKAIEAVHTDPGHNWNLAQLASLSGMSRATFALKFKTQTGLTPIYYLAQWRMQIACELLEAGELSLAQVAWKVGYESEAAFSNAFCRILKQRPGSYRKNFASLKNRTEHD